MCSPRRTQSPASRSSISSTRSTAKGELDGFQFDDMPDDRDAWRWWPVVSTSRRPSAAVRRRSPPPTRRRTATIVERFASGELSGGAWSKLNVNRAFSLVMRVVLSCFYSHPWAWNEIGFGGPAYPARLQPVRQPAPAKCRARDLGGRGGLRPRPRQRPRRAPAAAMRLTGKPDQGREPDAGRQRLGLAASPPQARPAEPRSDAPLLDERVRRPGRGRRRCRRCHARPAAGARRLADGSAGEGAVLGSGPRLGLGREGCRADLLDR